MCAVIPVAGQRTHGATYLALKVSLLVLQLATQGEQCAVLFLCVKKGRAGRDAVQDRLS